jgi:pimeloyl-ACP methyl ester carboxylesterase
MFFRSLIHAGLGLALVHPLPAQEHAQPWADPSPHEARFVFADDGTRLEFLDWGGSGELVLFLAGGGSSAHYFDSFAPRLTDEFRVVALTRRSHGASEDAAFDLGTLPGDIRALLDHLEIQQAHLIGVSWAGEELTRFAGSYPDRVLSLVYVDAALDRTANADARLLQRAPRPPRSGADMESIGSLATWIERYGGYSLPRPELRASYILSEDGAVLGPRITAETRRMLDAAEERPRYSEVQARALAIYAMQDALVDAFPWVLADPAAMEDALRFPVRSYIDARYAEVEQFRSEVVRGRVVIMDAPHHVILARAKESEAVIRAFLLNEP